MLLKPLILVATLVATASSAVSYDYNRGNVKGVNLGGWLVTEPWITPNLYAAVPGVVDEFTLCQRLGKTTCLNHLRAHWESFYSAADFQAIRNAGLNHVRIPIGYWAVKPWRDDPYVQGQIAYLDRAIGWSRAAGLKVWIDLHGAPGSQNGFDNSGHRDFYGWIQQAGNVPRTVEVIEALAKKYSQGQYADVVTAIQLLNEPAGFDGRFPIPAIKSYWERGYRKVRQYGSLVVIIHDAFQPMLSWNGYMAPQSPFRSVALDTHQYQVFSVGQLKAPINNKIQAACEIGRQLRATDKWTVVGEWSGALTDCTQWLNGVGRGTRWEGTWASGEHLGSCASRYRGSSAQLSAGERTNTRRFIEAQLDAYSRRSGYFFWTWKTQNGAPGWDLRDLIQQGLFPQPPESRMYPNQCGF